MDTFMNQLVSFIADTVDDREAIISLTSPGFGGSGSVNSGFVNLILKDADDRELTQQQIADNLSMSLGDLNDARVFVTQQQTIGGGRGGLPVQYVIQAPILRV
jgi:multidrug efflux pump